MSPKKSRCPFKFNQTSKRTFLYTASILIPLFLGLIYAGRQVILPSYPEKEAELIASQYTSPDKALTLAEALMKDHPSQCMPYEIAANIYARKKNFSAAETSMRSAIEECFAQPDVYVRLAHFYQRVAPEKLNPWILKMLQRPYVISSPTLAAKLLNIRGDRSKAIRHLEEAGRTNAFSLEACIMLSRLYSRQNQYTKSRQLLMDFAGKHPLNQSGRIKLLKEIFSAKAPLNRLQTDFSLGQIVQLAEDESGYGEGRRQLFNNLEKLISLDTGRHAVGLIRTRLNNSEKQHGWIWLSSIYLQTLENPKAAYEFLSEFETTDVRLLEEKARLAVHSGDLKQITSAWEALLKLGPDNLPIRLAYAQSLNRAGFRDASRRISLELTQDQIPKDLRRSYFILRFDNEAALDNYAALVDTWLEAGAYYTYNDFLIFKEIIFSHLTATENRCGLLKALKSKRSELPPTKYTIELLQAFIAEKLGDAKLYFTSIDAFLTEQAAPEGWLINLFVDSAIAKISLIHSNEKKSVRPLPQEARFAVKWSGYLTDRRPDNLSYRLNQAVSVYLAGGEVLNLARRCRILLKGSEKHHHLLQLAAAKLFRVGCFQLSAEYYQKAIALRPNIIRYRFSLASCLRRLNKYDQARQVYTQLIMQPSVKSGNLQTVLQHLWLCYEKQRITAKFPALIETLISDPHIDDNTVRLTAGTLLLEKTRYRAAEKLLKEFIEKSKDQEKRYEAYLKLAQGYALQKKYDDAIGLYTTCLRAYQGDILKNIDCLYNRAEIKRRKGDYQSAVNDWSRIARNYPEDVIAAEALLAAASAAQAIHNLPQAKHLYQTYLNLPEQNRAMTGIVKAKLLSIAKTQ